MKQYKLVNNLVGWFAFVIDSFYLLYDYRTDSQFLGLPGIYHYRI